MIRENAAFSVVFVPDKAQPDAWCNTDRISVLFLCRSFGRGGVLVCALRLIGEEKHILKLFAV